MAAATTASTVAPAAPTHVSHHDASRAAVSTTALGVCALRVWESKKDPSVRLIDDPFAAVLCGSDSPELPLQEEADLTIPAIIQDPPPSFHHSAESLGAGFAMGPTLPQGTHWIDREATLLEQHAPVAQPYVVCPGNLVQDSWETQLLSHGFRREVPTMWLLEGLTGYLTEPELETLFGKLSTLATETSRMTATFVGNFMHENATSMHRYLVSGPEQIESVLSRFGWTANKVHYVGEIAERYGRKIPKDFAYFLVSAARAT
eukprot:Skav233021  [mRNA]  locus=scaffold909:385052:391693:+ [translate_table: standard]